MQEAMLDNSATKNNFDTLRTYSFNYCIIVMRTLAKPLKAPKEKETTPKKPNNKSQKKPSKTVFTDPFRYKV